MDGLIVVGRRGDNKLHFQVFERSCLRVQGQKGMCIEVICKERVAWEGYVGVLGRIRGGNAFFHAEVVDRKGGPTHSTLI